MRLTLHTDYALRLLMLLAMEPEGVHTAASVARRYQVSRHHIMKVAQTLMLAGFVKSVRGRNGGFHLAMPPEDISVGAVIRTTEDDLCLTGCFDPDGGGCLMAPACGARRVLHRAMAAFFATLDPYTLADLMTSPGQVSRMQALLQE